MPRIFDNIELSLLPALSDTLRMSERADFCVGYFNLRGWQLIDHLIETWSGGEGACCRLIVGMSALPQEELRQAFSLASGPSELDAQAAILLRKRVAEEFRQQLSFGAPNNRDEAGLRRLSTQLKAKKLIVKLFLRHQLHAKLYLIHRFDPNNPSTGFLGSSNLTLAGLSKQGELNVDVLSRRLQQVAKVSRPRRKPSGPHWPPRLPSTPPCCRADRRGSAVVRAAHVRPVGDRRLRGLQCARVRRAAVGVDAWTAHAGVPARLRGLGAGRGGRHPGAPRSGHRRPARGGPQLVRARGWDPGRPEVVAWAVDRPRAGCSRARSDGGGLRDGRGVQGPQAWPCDGHRVRGSDPGRRFPLGFRFGSDAGRIGRTSNGRGHVGGAVAKADRAHGAARARTPAVGRRPSPPKPNHPPAAGPGSEGMLGTSFPGGSVHARHPISGPDCRSPWGLPRDDAGRPPGPRPARGPAELATSKALFDQAITEINRGEFTLACPRLKEVVKLIPDGIGAMITLAYLLRGRRAPPERVVEYTVAQAAANSAGQAIG